MSPIARLEKALSPDNGWTDQHAPDLHKWERPGETIAGKLISISRIQLDNKPVWQYLFATDSSHTLKMLGTYDLTQKLTRRHVGMLVRIKYLGEDENIRGGPNNQPMKVFSVQVKPDPDAPAGQPRDPGPISDEDVPF